MTKPTRTDVSELGEFGLIDRIQSMVVVAIAQPFMALVMIVL